MFDDYIYKKEVRGVIYDSGEEYRSSGRHSTRKRQNSHGRPLQRLDISWDLHSNIFLLIVQLKFSALIISFHNIFFIIILLLYMTEGFCIGELMSENLRLQRLEMPSGPKVHSFHGRLSYFPELIANREQILIQMLLIIVLYDTLTEILKETPLSKYISCL